MSTFCAKSEIKQNCKKKKSVILLLFIYYSVHLYSELAFILYFIYVFIIVCAFIIKYFYIAVNYFILAIVILVLQLEFMVARQHV